MIVYEREARLLRRQPLAAAFAVPVAAWHASWPHADRPRNLEAELVQPARVFGADGSGDCEFERPHSSAIDRAWAREGVSFREIAGDDDNIVAAGSDDVSSDLKSSAIGANAK